eukprot:TRINITY_DN3089_c0_g2_i7.p1 TRINITY_DN3089_c0_g2~~TRINITY_DN3089_c0_g2_i7.p1  ORF type:complete len:181 (-),score=52.61 TRINITY_DN3089_c0_g2_i7:603-1145(-)
MGGLLSCCGDENDSENGDYGERTRLLSEHSPSQTHVPELLHDSVRNMPFSSSLPKVNEEQNALQQIQKDIAANVIDISAIDHEHVLESNDIVEKSAIYTKRLTSVGSRLAAKHTKSLGLADVPAADVNRELSDLPIKQEDLELITEIAMRAEKEIEEFKIKHENDLVVEFGDSQQQQQQR